MSDDILKLFEGLSPDQAKALRARIVPALQQIRAEIVTNPSNGNHKQGAKKMDETPELPEDATVEEIVLAMREHKARKQQAQAQTQPANQLDEQEAAEIAELQTKARGQDYINRKFNIQQKYSAMRNQQSAPVDLELEQAKKGGDGAVLALFQKRLGGIRRGDVRKFSEWEAAFHRAIREILE